jgi:UDP-N-acetylglucosamine:LPS N-acetylglucosamine transferase
LETVQKLLREPDSRNKLGENARKMALEDADEKIVDEILAIVNAKK